MGRTLLWAYATWDPTREDLDRLAYAFAPAVEPFAAEPATGVRYVAGEAGEAAFHEGMRAFAVRLATAANEGDVFVAGPQAADTRDTLRAYNEAFHARLSPLVLDTDALEAWAVLLFHAAPLPRARVFGDPTEMVRQAMARTRALHTLTGQKALFPKARR